MSMEHQQLDIPGSKIMLEMIKKSQIYCAELFSQGIVPNYKHTFLDGFLFFSLLNLFDGGMYLSSSSLSANS